MFLLSVFPDSLVCFLHKCFKNLAKIKYGGENVSIFPLPLDVLLFLMLNVIATCDCISLTSFFSALNYDMDKHCNIEIAAQVSRISSRQSGTSFFDITSVHYYCLLYHCFYTSIYERKNHIMLM